MEKKLTRSEARKKDWAKIPKAERVARARKMAIARARKMTTEERRAHALMMVKARLKKQT